MNKEYRLAVSGARNLTPIGRTYATIREAREDAARVNRGRAAQGLKLAVAIKTYRAGCWQFVEWLEARDDDDEPIAPVSGLPATTATPGHSGAFPRSSAELANITKARHTGELAPSEAIDRIKQVSERLPNPITMFFTIGE